MIRRGVRPSSNYLVIANSVVCDRRISFAASGLLLHLLSKPDHWEVSPTALAKEAKEGRDKIYKLLGELIKAGYCQRITQRGDGGKIIGTDYEIYDTHSGARPADEPLPEKPDTDLPDTGLPYPDFPTQESKDTKKVTNLENNQSEGVLPGSPSRLQNSRPAGRRGTRLPDDWKLPEEFLREAQRIRPDLSHRIYDIAENFRDYWKSLPDQRGVKCDWLATWRGWVRRERSMGAQPSAQNSRTRDRPISEILTDDRW